MAGVFEGLADIYAETRPKYPREWFVRLASLTPHHSVAWDAATGNGQAAVPLADHYDRVVATDMSEGQLKHAVPHPKVRYVHTPTCMPEDDLVALLGGEGSVDLVTVATAVHWFDHEKFYSVVQRVLRKPGGVVAVWGYREVRVCPSFDAVIQRFIASALPFWHPSILYIFEEYRNLPFPFDGVGLGAEGASVTLEIKTNASFEGILRLVRTWSVVDTAKAQGVDLLPAEVVEDLENAWGGRSLIREVTFPSFMIAGKPRATVTL
ncbi:unnamed protein product [Spirodela intermedia]|uniref:Methyltransferase type 11 domain-containing protein n=2 Tax=Spirodela intermedia TaxID=51605 RepID=A0A7I8KHL7_SPIIN|nr:unnamed protein product [Spirodela intermedia]CAA6660863.1 unnamed protein product [Spirodela intermedia]CAA7397220.1 unnamed protein product [Spirodela intermedia]